MSSRAKPKAQRRISTAILTVIQSEAKGEAKDLNRFINVIPSLSRDLHRYY